MRKEFDIRVFFKHVYKVFLLIDRSGRKLALINMVLLALQAVLPILSLFFVKRLVELVVDPERTDFDTVIPYIAGFCLLQFLLVASAQISAYLTKLQQQNLTDLMSGLVLNKASEVELEYYENPSYHDTLHLAQQQARYKGPQVLANINEFVHQSASLFCLIFFFISIQWSLALLFVLLFIPLSAVQWYYSYKLYKLELALLPDERLANYYHNVLTSISHAKEVRTLGFADSFIHKFRSLRLHIHGQKKKIHFNLTVYSLALQTIEVIVLVVFFLSLAKQAWTGAITAGVLVVYIQGFQRLQSTLRNFLQALIKLFQQRLFLNDLFGFLSIDTAPAATDTKPFPDLISGLVVKDLSFTYPQTERRVLKNINLTCEPGKMIAIVGENGSGKSTLVKLLARLYTIQDGTIALDDTNVRDINIRQFRERTSFLFQDFERYYLTVEDNIMMGNTGEHSEQKVRVAGELSGADEFIRSLSAGYKTLLGRTFRKSEQLSGGQWQKLAWARMFYKGSKVIVLDEPTSAIDAISEQQLFSRLKEFATDKIIILISHRLYHLKVADHIYVMKDGEIAEHGDFNALIQKDGLFRKMYESQQI